jgi:hypothetical protein
MVAWLIVMVWDFYKSSWLINGEWDVNYNQLD